MNKPTIQNRQSIRANQQGMVSILVTMILMIVMSLIVLGFAQNSRRNQRETLDRQLSTQAFYAAESGVNDARDLITKSTSVPPSKTSCTDAGTGGFYQSLLDNSTIDATHNVSYSCVLIDPAPKQLDYDSVSTTGTVVPIFSGTGGSFGSIDLTWQSKTGSTTPTNNCPSSYTAGNNIFTPTANWTCGYGVLRLDLVPVSGNVTASGLQSATRTIFAVPTRTAGTNTYSFTGDGNSVIGVKCTDTSCTLNVKDLGGSQYYLRMMSIYQDVSMKITSSLGLSGAQVVIDSTGKAQDVLRRIQVHLPISVNGSKNQLPDNALQSTDSVCKKFAAMDGYFDNNVTTGGNNDLCR